MKQKQILLVTPLLAGIFSIALFVFGIFPISSAGCDGSMILEKKDINFFEVEQVGRAPVELFITGVAMRSALAIESIETSQSDDVLHLKICLKPASAELSGSIAHHLAVPETVRKIVLGKEQTIIWTRNSYDAQPR